MKMKVLGVQRGVSFKVDGREFSGLNLYCGIKRENVDGLATEKIYVSLSKDCYSVAAGLKVGDEIEAYYNRYGKVESIVPAK